MSDRTLKAWAWGILLGSCAVVVFGIWWLLWLLWTSVVPALLPQASPAWTQPGYWTFCGGWALMLIFAGILRRIFK